MFDANHDIAIGAVARVPQLGENFNGLIDEVAIWNEALDADAIAAVYKNGVIPAPSDLTGNGFVDFEDLTVLLANWNKEVGADAGNLVNPTTTPVNFEDLTVLLADWTGPDRLGRQKRRWAKLCRSRRRCCWLCSDCSARSAADVDDARRTLS